MEDIKLAMTIPFKPEQWTFTEMEDKVSRPSMESINASLKQKGINVDFFIKLYYSWCPKEMFISSFLGDTWYEG